MDRLMRRQENRRGAMVTGEAGREGCSPELTVFEMADGLKTPAGNSGHGEELKGQAVPAHPGSQTVSCQSAGVRSFNIIYNSIANLGAHPAV